MWAVTGAMAFGALLSAITDAASVFTPQIAAAFTISIAVLWVTLEAFLRRKGLTWHGSGDRGTVRGFGPRVRAAIIGVVILPWCALAVRNTTLRLTGHNVPGASAQPGTSGLRVDSTGSPNSALAGPSLRLVADRAKFDDNDYQFPVLGCPWGMFFGVRSQLPQASEVVRYEEDPLTPFWLGPAELAATLEADSAHVAPRIVGLGMRVIQYDSVAPAPKIAVLRAACADDYDPTLEGSYVVILDGRLPLPNLAEGRLTRDLSRELAESRTRQLVLFFYFLARRPGWYSVQIDVAYTVSGVRRHAEFPIPFKLYFPGSESVEWYELSTESAPIRLNRYEVSTVVQSLNRSQQHGFPIRSVPAAIRSGFLPDSGGDPRPGFELRRPR